MNLWNQMLRNEKLDDESDLEDETKWTLENLFNIELEVPEYVNNL
ncbi:2468_t:CDS:2 [Funneliformis mosseae]|uniref:2468_t:CDS:1 n=1 Tax=Funneliformis mosseae TaxID=27381 RepID=A0A9N9B204_FUNMO|nr:2468_t:CDS:2 [Funneliformis mosseae]